MRIDMHPISIHQIKTLFLCVIAYVQIHTGFSEPVPLTLEVKELFPTQAVLTWSGLDIDRIKYCTLSYSRNSTLSQIEPRTPTNDTLVLPKLTPNTTYSVFMECKDKNEEEHRSNVISARIPSDQPLPVPNREPPHHHPVSNGDILDPTSQPPVTREKIKTDASPTDVALGVVLGLLGMGVLVTVAYYVIKKYRRQQRIRRLLQYRRHDADPFADADADIDTDQ